MNYQGDEARSRQSNRAGLNRRTLLVIVLFVLLTVTLLYFTRLPSRSAYQVPPEVGDGWETTSLSEVGMAEAPVIELLSRLDRQKGHQINSLLVVKKGKLVLESYYPGVDITVTDKLSFTPKAYDRDTLHCLASASKSVTSILFGIACDQGKVASLDEKMFASFPEYAHLNDAVKEQITLRHLLSMTPGISWDESLDYNDSRNNLNQLLSSQDPLRYMLTKSLDAMPGEEFIYNSGVTNLLGEILNRKTGSPLLEFAADNLFSPLGITSYEWLAFPADPDMLVASSLLYLRPRDMAKLGQLFLQKGEWNGEQIVSTEWIQESTAESVALDIRYSPVFQATGYGYQWWRGVFANGNTQTFYAAGWGGQHIFIFPEFDLVVVLTGSNHAGDGWNVFDIVNQYILGAVIGQEK